MDANALTEITRKELVILKEFLKALKEERDAIISFSLEGIIRENNKKEEILKRLEDIELEKEKLLATLTDIESVTGSDTFRKLRDGLEHTMGEVRSALEKNMKLLSFSMDHVKSSMDHIVGFLNNATYGRKKQSLSVLLSREI
ncbi:MAG: FlgN protein [Syntrophorhabdus sp. PtaU1.Bin002]|nr:MAG: FlgN protein [Syntrophorhabdus sp. PtaB.Bin006]OPY73570.1 MAG: FlgN protein [Syntrophorhabdus sp. PtaU1.Bin002]